MQSDDVMKHEEYSFLTKINPVRTWISISVDYAVILFLVGIVIAIPHPAVVVLSIILIARQQHALTILIHEGAHYRLFSSKRLNDVVVRWLLAGPLFLNYDGYRGSHLDHHRYTMTSKDPDLRFVDGFPVSRNNFVTSFLPDFLGVTYLFLLLLYSKHALSQSRSIWQFILRMLPGILINTLALGLLAIAGYGTIYFILWIVPMFFMLPFFLHLRGICEHGGHHADPDPMKCTWTVINAAQTFAFAPHHINYHMEHHGYPAVPHFNLPGLHDLLKKCGELPMQNIKFSYRSIISNLIVSK